MIASTAEGADLARLLLDLLIVLFAARLAAEVAERLRVPAVLGEIVAGVLIGPSVIGLVELNGERGISIAVLAEIGVLLLLLQVGMEMDIGELQKVGRASVLVALIGVAVPFGGGAIAGALMGETTNTAIFLGAALTATSVGITARVFGDLRALATTEARIVLGAAVADDVLGLVILTVVVKIVTGGSVGFGTVAGTLGLALGFLLLTGAVGLLLVPRLLDVIQRRASSGATVVVAAMVITLGFAELADAAKLAFIIGAFMAGLALGKSEHHERLSRDLGAVGNIFIPVFFVQIGINADIGAMTKPSVLGLAAVLTVVGIVGKLAAAFGALGTRTDKLLIGLGMIPRGEVGLIFASIGLTNGVLDTDLYGALLVVVLVTTLMTPPLLRLRIGRRPDGELPTDGHARDLEPNGGWLEVVDGEVRLRSTPPVGHTVPISLGVAGMAASARPGDDLLDWFGQHQSASLTWQPADTEQLLGLLRVADARAWRLLDVTSVLERALPEVAAAMRRRRSDIRDLDPIGSLRFPTVEGLRASSPDALGDDHLVLAAFAIDVCEDTSAATCASDLMVRLGRGAEADEIGRLVTDAALLRAGAGRAHGFESHELLQLASHLGDAAHARRSHELAVAMGDLPTWQREALQERLELIQQSISHPEVTGVGATNVAASRRQAAERLAEAPDVIERLRHAPTAYLLEHDPPELARQAQLVEPLPHSGSVRVAVSPDPEADHWRIDVACRDSSGLLAHLASVLAAAALHVVSASLATWPDGAVMATFTCRGATRPSPRDLAHAMEAALRARLRPNPVHDLTMEFDNTSLPWHTSCVVRGPDQPGALQAVAAAFANSDIVIHSARVSSANGAITDRFSLTDRIGRRLDAAAMTRSRAALAGNDESRRRSRRHQSSSH